MSEPELMTGSPPPSEQQVTLHNWRVPPFNRWSFHHVQELVPSATIEPNSANHTEFTSEQKDLSDITFIDHLGAKQSVAEFMPANQTDAFLVLHQGRVVYERYFNGMREQTPHIAMSVSKSLTAGLVGVFVDRGLLDPKAGVTRLLPELQGSAFEDCTLQHLLDMTAGVEFSEDYLAASGDIVEYREVSGWKPLSPASEVRDLRTWLTLRKKSGVHGAAFHYVSPCTDLLGWVLERAGGKPFHELFSEMIWQPLGAKYPAYVTVDALGAPRTAGGICLSLRDLARFGQLYLNQGQHKDRPLISKTWVHDTTQNFDRDAWRAGELADFLPTGGYRNKWWILGNDLGAFTGIGVYGQWIYVAPKTDTVIAVFSSQPLPVDDNISFDSLACFDAIARGW